jgi:hypothetical protein
MNGYEFIVAIAAIVYCGEILLALIKKGKNEQSKK